MSDWVSLLLDMVERADQYGEIQWAMRLGDTGFAGGKVDDDAASVRCRDCDNRMSLVRQ